MNNYIHKIIDFFFHHEASDEITERVYNRMVFPVEDKAREEAVSQIWDKLDDASCSDEKIEKAFYNLETSLGLKKRRTDCRISTSGTYKKYEKNKLGKSSCYLDYSFHYGVFFGLLLLFCKGLCEGDVVRSDLYAALCSYGYT